MEYTVHQLAQLAGISVRTLQWYDEIGLLHPARTTQAGYRLYGPAEVNRLQDVLFYRALGVPLKQIAPLLGAPSYCRLAALESHRAQLEAERARLNALLVTLEKTIQTEKGEDTMTDREKFEGFKRRLVEENEAAYGAEVRSRYGEEAANASNAKLMGMSEADYSAMQALAAELQAALEAAVAAGSDPRGAEGQRIAALHKQWLCFTWGKYTPQAHAGVAQMYVADERFTAYYDSKVPGCAQFLCDAVATFTQ